MRNFGFVQYIFCISHHYNNLLHEFTVFERYATV